MFFIAGITGHIGGAAGRKLLAEGRRVRALVRDPDTATAWADRGVELRAGDLTDPDTLAAALDGVEAAFLLQPTPMGVTRAFPEARAIPRGRWPAVLEHMGLPPEKMVNWEEMQDGFNSGWIDFGRPGTEAVAGTTKPAEVFANAGQPEQAGSRSARPVETSARYTPIRLV